MGYDTETLVKEIHKSGRKLVLAITGGCSEVISELLRYGGGSSTVVEAIVPYDTKALEEFIHGKPDKYCSAETARAMAVRAFERCNSLHRDDVSKNIGFGITASLAKENQREGRKNRAFVAIQSVNESRCTEIVWEGNGPRLFQEVGTTLAALDALAVAVGMSSPQIAWNDGTNLRTTKVVSVNQVQQPEITDFGCVMPGSFNPIHQSHLEMAEYGAKITGKPTLLELSVSNVDKPQLDYISIKERLDSIAAANASYIAGTQLTAAPLFAMKARLFPGRTFLVGMDTINRIADPKYYTTPFAFAGAVETFDECFTKFLVFNRLGVEPAFDLLKDFVTIAPDTEFTSTGLSSTQIRQERNKHE